MKAATRYLTSVAQSLSTMMLYPREHPAWGRAVDASYAQLRALQEEDPRPRFSFIGADVIHGTAPLHELKDWPWASRLAEVGVQRLEFTDDVGREEYESFLADVLARMVQAGVDPEAAPGTQRRSIRFGAVVVHNEDGSLAEDEEQRERPPTRGASFELTEEVSAVRWLQDEVQGRTVVPLTEADAVVRSLTVAMRGSSAMIIPLLRLKASDPYNAIHSINVAVLAMALGEFLGLGNRDIHDFGMAALLHDLGMARVPRELLAKPAELSDAERATIERHPIDGARIILASDKRMETAAVVAYEHHLRPDGTGYPQRLFPRPPHFASRFVRVCSVYNALRIPRPHRHAYTAPRALTFIEERAGKEFDAELAHAFVTMMRRLEPRIADLEHDVAVRTPFGGMPAIPEHEIHH